MPRVDYALVCDDVRTEINGKTILIGIYTADIVVAGFPAALNLCFWGTASGFAQSHTTLRFRIHDGEGTDFAALDGQFDGAEIDKPTLFVIPRVSIAYAREGRCILSVRFDDGPETDVLVKRVLPGAVASAF